MTDEAALCRLTQLTGEQLAGLDSLAAMTADELDEFGRRVDMAWDTNGQAVTLAKRAVTEALHRQAEVETECGMAARRRFLAAGGNGVCSLDDTERARVEEVRAATATARAHLEEAKARFKAGIGADQLGGDR